MTDAIKGTRPLVPKNQVEAMRPLTDPARPFETLATHNPITRKGQSKDFNQQGQMLLKEAFSGQIAHQMNDVGLASAATHQLRYLQELVSLITLKSEALSNELLHIQEGLYLTPDQLLGEIKAQSALTSRFQGAAYESLLDLLQEAGGQQSDVGQAIAEVLRSINQPFLNQEMREALMRNLQILARQFEASPSFSEAFEMLAQEAGRIDSEEAFIDFQTSLNQWGQKLQNSVLYNGSLARRLELVLYNLSRLNFNTSMTETSLNRLRLVLHEQGLGTDFIDRVSFEDEIKQVMQREGSSVYKTLSNMLQHDGLRRVFQTIDPAIQDKLIHSLLESFYCQLPLIHLVLPFYDGTGREYGEAWIEYQEKQQKDEKNGLTSQARLLLVLDIQGIGPLEAEMLWEEGRLSIDLFCQEHFMIHFVKLGPALSQHLQNTRMRIGQFRVLPWQRKRALSEIFPKMTIGRRGVDVRI